MTVDTREQLVEDIRLLFFYAMQEFRYVYNPAYYANVVRIIFRQDSNIVDLYMHDYTLSIDCNTFHNERIVQTLQYLQTYSSLTSVNSSGGSYISVVIRGDGSFEHLDYNSELVMKTKEYQAYKELVFPNRSISGKWNT